MPIHPQDIQSSPTHLTVQWEDGHQSVYRFAALRAYCPCAECRTTTPQEILDRGKDTPIYPQDAEDIGHYAIRITWSDRHDTGIYTWDLLRSLCPCEQCHGPGGD